MRNVILVQPNFSMGTDTVKEYYLPHSGGLLWAYSYQHQEIKDNFRLSKIIFKRDPIDSSIDNLEEPNVAIFSNYIWNWEYNKKFAKKLKEKYPNCLIVFGGPQVTDKPFEKLFLSKHKYVDIVVNGEGEIAFYEILKRVISGEKQTRLLKMDRIQDLSIVPSPYLSGVFDNIIKENPNTTWQFCIETNRGCPFQCTFCDWGGTTYSKIKKFDIDRIENEVKWALANHVRHIFITDANFGVFYERDKEIATKLMELSRLSPHPVAFSATWHKNSTVKTLEIAEIMSSRGVTIALQSLDGAVLKAIKRDNMKINNMKEIIDECDKRNLPVYSEIILGLPHETYDTWKNGIYSLLDVGLHTSLDSYFCGILENAELNLQSQKEEHGLDVLTTFFEFIDNDEAQEYQDIIRATKYMPREDMIRSYMFTWAIIVFHYSGWLQVYSRYLNKKHGISYREFYDDIIVQCETEGTLFNSYYKETKDLIAHFLETGQCKDPYATSKFGWNTILKLYENHKETEQYLLQYVENKYKNVLEQDSTFDSVRTLQLNYNVDIEKEYPYKLSLDNDVYNYIFHDGDIQPKVELELDINFYYRDKNEFHRRMYLERRRGASRPKIAVLG